MMRHAYGLFLLAILLFPAAPAGAEAPSVTVTPLLSVIATASGQAIALPQGKVRVIVSTFVIEPGASLPVHRHKYPRYAYVQEGTLKVTLAETKQSFVYQPGDFVLEVIGQWHFAENIGTTPVRLLVIDQVPEAETANTEVKK